MTEQGLYEQVGGGGVGMAKKHFIEMFIVKMYFHFKTLSMLIMYAESLIYDV